MNEIEATQEIMDIQIRAIKTRGEENRPQHRIFQNLSETEIMEEAKNKILLKLTNHGVNYRYSKCSSRKCRYLEMMTIHRNDRFIELFQPRDPRLEKELFGNVVPGGINFDQYDDIPVDTSGENVPEPIKESFFS